MTTITISRGARIDGRTSDHSDPPARQTSAAGAPPRGGSRRLRTPTATAASAPHPRDGNAVRLQLSSPGNPGAHNCITGQERPRRLTLTPRPSGPPAPFPFRPERVSAADDTTDSEKRDHDRGLHRPHQHNCRAAGPFDATSPRRRSSRCTSHDTAQRRRWIEDGRLCLRDDETRDLPGDVDALTIAEYAATLLADATRENAGATRGGTR